MAGGLCIPFKHPVNWTVFRRHSCWPFILSHFWRKCPQYLFYFFPLLGKIQKSSLTGLYFVTKTICIVFYICYINTNLNEGSDLKTITGLCQTLIWSAQNHIAIISLSTFLKRPWRIRLYHSGDESNGTFMLHLTLSLKCHIQSSDWS